MKIFCIPEFKDQYDKLLRKKSYKSIEQTLFEFLIDKKIEDLKTGTNLSTFPDKPFIKKRLEGSGGFRLYYFMLVIKNNVYLTYLHPKTGSMGIESLKDWKDYLKITLIHINNNNLYEVKVNKTDRNCSFHK